MPTGCIKLGEAGCIKLNPGVVGDFDRAGCIKLGVDEAEAAPLVVLSELYVREVEVGGVDGVDGVNSVD